VENLKRFFELAVGKEPWSLQVYWMKRLLSGESFAMIAPTGMGKSTLLAVYALYRACIYGWRVYIVTPTREIAKQFSDRIAMYLDRVRKLVPLEREPRVLFYDSSSSRSRALREAIARGEFDILITSAGFLSRNFELLRDKKVDLVVADDLDALMKRSRNIDRILRLLGFEEEDIELATRLAKARQRLIASKLSASPEALENLRAEVIELEARLRSRIAERGAQLVVASATGRVRGLKPLVLRELLGFEGGALFEYWRNVVDLVADADSIETTLPAIVRELGSGIVFVATRELEPEKVLELLQRHGVRAAIAKSGTRAVDRFRRGEVDVLVGKASYYGILVRGLDEPLRVRFVAFIGVPKIVKTLEQSLYSVRFLYAVLQELRRLGMDVSDEMRSLISVLQRCTPAMLSALSKWLREPDSAPPNLLDIVETVKRVAESARARVLEALKHRDRIRVSNLALIVRIGSEILVMKPDPYTYIQASGRCSRLLNGSKTFGVSIVFERYRELVEMLEARLRKIALAIEFKPLDPSLLPAYRRAIEASRRIDVGSRRDVRKLIKTALIVVESPTKARTIASMFGRPARRSIGSSLVYETVIPLSSGKILVASIMASLGHVTDLVTDEGVHGVRIVDGEFVPVYDFITRCRECGSQHVGVYALCPYCGSPNVYCSYATFNAIKKVAIDVDEVYIGTDPDTEGEKIAFDIATLLKPYNPNIARIEFHEVTKRAILRALESPRSIDVERVEAQIARRVADRWIGFEVSLWLQRELDKPWLGAGRVQSPVLLWVVDRYREYQATRGFAVVAVFESLRVTVFFERREDAEKAASELRERGAVIESVELYERELPPPPPFTTDELLYEAGKRLGLSVSAIMSLAQTLFESGLITYHRTDSSRVSPTGIAVAKQALERMGLSTLFVPRSWGAREGAQDAHECIRPTTPLDAEGVREAVLRGEFGLTTKIGEKHLRLYDLIYRRFLASQMKSSRVLYARVRLRVWDRAVELEIPIEVVEEGFTAVYPVKLYPQLRDELKPGKSIVASRVEVVRRSRVRLYTCSDLVKMLRDRGIGRPSTYAKAIDNNVRHGYIVLSKRRKFAIPTKLGIVVSDIIRDRFLELVGEDVTRKLEEEMDLIERGEKDFQTFAREIYELVESILAQAPSVEASAREEGLEARSC